MRYCVPKVVYSMRMPKHFVNTQKCCPFVYKGAGPQRISHPRTSLLLLLRDLCTSEILANLVFRTIPQMVPPSMESRNGHSDDLPATPVYPIHNARKMRVICVGAGLSGLCFAYKLQRSFEDFTLQIFERNEGISGVWFNNRYPG